nr:hypothetical protein [uncultured Roseovarius sp.]
MTTDREYGEALAAKFGKQPARPFQTLLSEYVNQAVRDFLTDHPEALLSDVQSGLRDALADAPAIYDAANPEPEPFDAEAVAAWLESYERDLIAAGRGHLVK